MALDVYDAPILPTALLEIRPKTAVIVIRQLTDLPPSLDPRAYPSQMRRRPSIE
jgi:hypothetical protein